MPTLTTPHSWLATFVAVLALTGTPLPSLADGAPSAAGVAAAGWKQFSVEAHGADDPAINLALSYPTRSPARHVAMGPFSVDAAINAPSDDHLLGLIVLSHGAGGTELGHGAIAQALARHGYLVAALRHPGDNWQDSSLLGTSQYFYARPRQVSRVISALLADPQWGPRIATDARGPRIGALGHSAGGYTVIALVGGEPAVSRIVTHCGADAAADPIFCGMGRPSRAALTTPGVVAKLADERVRAVAALAPVGVVFKPDSLAAIRVPTVVYSADLDRFLVPRFHAEAVAAAIPSSQLRRVGNASHFAFMDPPTMAIPSPDGDLRADPAGFDRLAFLDHLGQDICDCFDRSLR